jgi:hypothetical protein
MDHTLAQKTNTVDKYLMSDLTHDERLAFEEHMFECPDCAAQVKQGFEMIDAFKHVMREDAELGKEPSKLQAVEAKGSWRDWFRPAMLAPALAACSLAIVVGYQNLVTIPDILQPQVLETAVIQSGERRGPEAQAVTVKPGAAFFGVGFQVFSKSKYPGYDCEFMAAGSNRTSTMDCGKHATAEFNLSLLLPSAKFPPGVYTMILRPVSDKQTEVSRYSFAVRSESN